MLPVLVARPSKIYPNWDFWFENRPSGNPGYLHEMKSWLAELARKLSGTVCIIFLQNNPSNFKNLKTTKIPSDA
jgi:hypothetical protein